MAVAPFLVGAGISLLVSAFLNQRGSPDTPENQNRAKEALLSDPALVEEVAQKAGVDLGAIDAAGPKVDTSVKESELDLFGDGSDTAPPPSGTETDPTGPTPPTVDVQLLGPQLDDDAIATLEREIQSGQSGAGIGAGDIAGLLAGGGAGALLVRELLKRQGGGAERVQDFDVPPGRVTDVSFDATAGGNIQNPQLNAPRQPFDTLRPTPGQFDITPRGNTQPVTPNASGPAQIAGDPRRITGKRTLPPPTETIRALMGAARGL